MVVQRLGLHAFTARGMGLIPALGTKTPHATRYGQKLKKKRERERERQHCFKKERQILYDSAYMRYLDSQRQEIEW